MPEDWQEYFRDIIIDEPFPIEETAEYLDFESLVILCILYSNDDYTLKANMLF